MEKRPDAPNQIQYHHRVYNKEVRGKMYAELVQVGFENPTGYNQGDKIIISGRTEERCESKEVMDFFNRKRGHVVLFVQDPPTDVSVGGNGGFIWIESTEGMNDMGLPTEHTADYAYAVRQDRSEL